MAGQFVTEVNDSTFEQDVLKSDQPVLVDFWAAWCGPCRALAPVVDEVATQYNGQLKVMKMDVDKNNATPSRYGIRGIPALLIFKDGKVADQIVGFVPKDTIEKSVSKVPGECSGSRNLDRLITKQFEEAPCPLRESRGFLVSRTR